MPQHAPQQSMQQLETIPGRPVIKASAVRLVSSHLYQPFDHEKMGTLQSLFGKVPGTADQLYICLHPASAPGLVLAVNACYQGITPEKTEVSHLLAFNSWAVIMTHDNTILHFNVASAILLISNTD